MPAQRVYRVWCGTHWRRDDTGEVMRMARAVPRVLHADAGAELDDSRRRALSQHALKSESLRALQACVELLKSEPGIAVALEDLDRDPFLLNVQNGTLQLRGDTAVLRPHDRADLITRMIPVAYDPVAEAPTWLAFLERIFAGRHALMRFMQKAAGYALTGDTREQVVFVLHGAGANGKSTLTLALKELLKAYAGTLSVETIMAKHQDATSMNDLHDVVGARFVAVVEPNLGSRLAEGFVKALTGGEEVSVKKLFADIYRIRPTFKVFLSTNHRPVIRGTDHAIWRRIRLVPFDVVIPDDQQDRQLNEKLRAEAPGILRWAVEGCLAWQAEGLGLPDEVRAATAVYRADMDTLGAFLRERAVVEPGASVSAAELYAAYRDWCGSAGEQPASQKALGLELVERGLTVWRTKRARGWAGIRLASEIERVTHEPPVTDDDAFLDSPPNARAGGEVQKSGSHVSPTRHQEEVPGWVTEADG